MDPNLVMVMPLCAPAASSDPLPLSKEETLLSIPGITMLSSVITLVIRQLILQTYPHDLPHDLIHRNLRNAWSQTIRTMVTASAMIVVVMTATDNGACITWIQMHRLHPAAKGRLVRPTLGLIEPEILGPHLSGSLNPHSLTLVDHAITHLVRPDLLPLIPRSLALGLPDLLPLTPRSLALGLPDLLPLTPRSLALGLPDLLPLTPRSLALSLPDLLPLGKMGLKDLQEAPLDPLVLPLLDLVRRMAR
jgi:hypothetical protein